MPHGEDNVLLSEVKIPKCLFDCPCERGGMTQTPQWDTVCANCTPFKIPLSLTAQSIRLKPTFQCLVEGKTQHKTGRPICFGRWTLEGKVALLVTPQNAKTTIMQSWHTVLPWMLFWNYAASATGNTQSSFTGAEIRLQWEVSSDAKIITFCYWNIWNIMTMNFVCTPSLLEQ